MSAGRTSGNIQTPWIKSKGSSLAVEVGHRPAALLHDLVKTCLWRQRVVQRRICDSVSHTIWRCEERFVFRQLLPVAAVDEQ